MQKMRISPHPPISSPGSIKGSQQMSEPAAHMRSSLPHTEARILSLEKQQKELHSSVRLLDNKYKRLATFMEDVKNHGCVRHNFTNKDRLESPYQTAAEFRAELDMVVNAAKKSMSIDTHGLLSNEANGSSPPALKPSNDSDGSAIPAPKQSSVGNNAKAFKSLPPHLRNAVKSTASTNASKEASPITSKIDALVTDGPVDPQVTPISNITPPASSRSVVTQTDMPELEYPKDIPAWMPYYIRSLPAPPAHILGNVPLDNMVTFSPDFINDIIKGESWSPGLRFLGGRGPHMLRNRTYYVLDPNLEPCLPAAPGQHGAKLTAFFKGWPEEFYDFKDAAPSYEDVPMFVETTNTSGQLRYVYYGNYSQTRWSDKLDYDTMMTKVPAEVKEYWAKELTSDAREDWVTDELKKHFFPKPEYRGCLFPTPGDGEDKDGVSTEVEAKRNQDMARDMQKYTRILRNWERESTAKTAMIKKDFILTAFETPDYAEMPTLRLSWEYLECVSWRKDFYHLLVTLQLRDPNYSK